MIHRSIPHVRSAGGLLLGLALLLSLDVSTAHADNATCQTSPGDVDDLSVDDITLRGVACFEARHYDWALTYYLKAYDRDADPFLYGAIGRALQELGLFSLAEDSFRQFIDHTPTMESSSAQRIERRLSDLEELEEEHMAAVAIGRPVPDATADVVFANGERFPIGHLPTTLRVDPGTELTVEINAPGYHPRRYDASAVDDQTSVEPALVADDASLTLSDRSRRRLGLTLGTGGLVVSSAGVALLFMGRHHGSRATDLDADDFNELSDLDRRQRHHLDRQDRYRRLGITGAAAGGAALIGASLIYLRTSSSTDATPDDAQAGLRPVAGPQSLGVRWRF